MKKIFQFLMIVSLSLTATSCYYDEIPLEPSAPIPEVVSYKDDIQPIWNLNCIDCHSSGQIEPELTEGISYNVLMGDGYVIPNNAIGSQLFKTLTGDGAPLMPPSGALSESDIALVEKWINDGALNN